MAERYRQSQLFEENPSLAWEKPEDQWFDRKSIRIKPNDFAEHLIGFANAEGGTIVIGVEKDGRRTGIDGDTERVNRLRQASIEYTVPPVRHTVAELSCIDESGEPNRLLVFDVHPSDHVHRDKRGEVFQRVGDQTRRLSEEQARELAFDKGEMHFDASPVPSATQQDLDERATNAFAAAVGLSGKREQALRARGFAGGRVECGDMGSAPDVWHDAASVPPECLYPGCPV